MYALTHLQATKGTWYWAVHFKRRGQTYYRRFYEPKYGGSPAARKAAIAWRDEQPARVKVVVASFMQPTAVYPCNSSAP